MQTYGPVDHSCIHSDTSIAYDDEAIVSSLPRAVVTLGDMILLKIMRGSEDASDECLGTGVPREESEQMLYRELGEAIYSAADVSHDAAMDHAKARLCGWAVGTWMRSHHRN